MPPDPNASAIDGITQALKAAPPLAQNPGLAVPAGTSLDPVGTAQTLDYQSQLNGMQAGAQRVHQSHGLFGSVFSFFGHAGSDIASAAGEGVHVVGQALNKPLQVAQHEYRYLHDVEARHGSLAAVGLGLGLLAAGVGAAVLAPEALPALAIGALAAEGAGLGAGQLAYKDSWQRTADGTKYLDPNTHQPVSLGRDFASGVLGEKPGSATFKWVSGVTDGIGDLAMDPTAKAGAIIGGVRLARVTAMTGDEFAHLAETSPRVSRAMDMIPSMDAGQITAHPQLGKIVAGDVATRTLPDGRQVSVPDETLAHQLGNATSRDEAIQIIRNRIDSQGLSKGIVPNVSLSGVPLDKLRQWSASGSRLAEFPGNLPVVGRVLPSAGKIARGQQLLPQELDPNTGAITNRAIDPYQGAAGRAIYQWLKGNGQAEQVAQDVATNFHNAVTYTDRVRIWRAAVFSAVKAQAVRKGMSAEEAAALSDEETQRQIAARFYDITGGEYPSQSAMYGVDHHDNLIPPTVSPDGSVRQSAVLDNQTGKISFPTHSEMRAAAGLLAGHKNLYGKADDFVYDHFTKTFFKRWVLSTGSFAAHVSLSEAVLNSLRLGLRPILQARLAASAAKGQIDDATEQALADPEAQKSIAARMYHMMGGGWRASAKTLTNPTWAKYAHEITHNNTWHGTVPPSMLAGHGVEGLTNTPEEVASFTMRDGTRRMKLIGGDDFSLFTPGESKLGGEYVRAWQQTLNQITKDPASALAAHEYKMALDSGKSVEDAHAAGVRAARLWLDQHPELHHLYDRANLPTQGWESMAPLDAFAHAKMLNVRGHTTGAAGTIHHDLLDAIIDGGSSKTPQLPDRITRDHLDAINDPPGKVLGRVYLPDPTAKLERVANKIHTFLARPIDFISREPTYLANYAKYRQRFQPLIDDGRIDEADAIVRSQTWAMQDMVRFVHNIHERTQLSELLRNYAPFWFAQQQAYKRVGRLLAENPGAFRKYQLMITGLHDVASNQTDAGGNNYVAFPGSGFIGSGTMGILSRIGLSPIGSTPVSFAGSLDSVSYIMPGAAGFRPDVGPIVAIPMKAIASKFPEMTPFASKVAGNITISEPMWKQFVPNSIAQHLIDSLGANSRSFTSTMMYTIQTLDYEQNVAEQNWIKGGRKGPPPQIVPPPNAGPIAMQNFINKIKNQTRIMYLIRAGLGLVSPLAPQLTVKDFGFPAKLQAQIQKAGSVTAGVDAFLKANPEATPFTVFQSTDPSGFSLPDSVQAENWINANRGLIAKYPYAAAWLMPQLTDTKYNAAVYNEQLAQGIRVKRSPQEFLNQLYIAAGNNTFYNVNRPVYEAALTSGQYDTTTLRSDWNTYIQQFGLQNPIWYNDYKSQDRITRRQETITELRDMVANPAIQSPMKAGIGNLIQSWDTFQTALVSGVTSKTDLADEYKSYLDGMGQRHPELRSFILSVLRPLAGTTSYVTTGVAA